MAVVDMAPDAAEALARRIADVATELAERAAVIDRLLDEAGKSSMAPSAAATAASCWPRSARTFGCGPR